MLGDPRKLTIEKRQQFKELATWLREMENKHSIMLYRQDLPGFGEPGYGYWDGFQRINSDTKSGGIMGVFKQFSPVKEQWITVNSLNPEKNYKVFHAPAGKMFVLRQGRNFKPKDLK